MNKNLAENHMGLQTRDLKKKLKIFEFEKLKFALHKIDMLRYYTFMNPVAPSRTGETTKRVCCVIKICLKIFFILYPYPLQPNPQV